MAELDDKAAFTRVAKAIAPVRDHLVVVGGWAHELHRYGDLARPLDFEPLRTEDVDLVASETLDSAHYELDRELAKQGFRAEPSGDDTPPATRYVLESDPSFYVQFLAPRVGSGESRTEKRRRNVQLAGVVAERLRHVDLLAIRPWRVELVGSAGFPVESRPLVVQVANATSFVAQKLLIAPQRSPPERAKDIAYVYETLVLFAENLERLGALWHEIAASMPRKTAQNVVKRARSLGAAVTDDIRATAGILQAHGRPHQPTPEAIRRGLDLGLSRILPT